MASFFRRRPDGGVSDIVGTTVLLAVTVLTVGAAAVGFTTMSPARTSTPRVDILANATESADGFVTLKHAGGDSLAGDGLELVVAGSAWPDPIRADVQLVDGPGDFELGDTAYVNGLGRPLTAGERVDILLYNAGGTFIGGASLVVAPGSSSPPVALDDFLVDIIAPAPGENVSAGGTMFLSAAVTHPEGRKSIDRVVADLSEVNGSSAQPLHDDGTLGDLVAGDGTYSSFLAIPPEAQTGGRNVSLRAYDLDARVNNGTGSDARIAITVMPSAISRIETIIAEFNNGTSGSNGFNGLPGGNGSPGSPGAGGNDGQSVNLTGPQGPPGSSGAAGSNGTAGASGANGTNGTINGSVPPLAGIPDIASMTPTSGRAGTIVLLEGAELSNVSGVLLAAQGSTTAFTASFGPDPNLPDGTGLLFAVPNIMEGSYVVNVTTAGGWATAPVLFRVEMPQPVIDSIDPPSARAYTQVNITGANFTAAVSVTLHNTAAGDVAVPWTVINDSSLVFVTHPGLPPGQYDVNVSTGFKWAIASLGFESLTPAAPSNLALSPTTAEVEQVVTITGTDLETVSRVTLNLTNGTRLIDAGWYLDGSAIKVAVPVAAAPAGSWNLVYTIELTGSFLGAVIVPEQLTVIPTAAPSISSFTPNQGEPFTQVNIFGTNFVNVKSVTFGETAVYFAVSGTHQILAVTHAGLGEGDYIINVTTATGTALSTTTFKALPLKLVPVYNKTIFEYWGTNITAGSGTNNDPVTLDLKFKLVNASWTVSRVTFNPVNYEPQSGSLPYVTVPRTCGPTNGVYLYELPSTPLHAYLSPANELDMVFGVTLNTGTSLITTYIFTNDETRNFILPAGQGTVTVLDHGEPINGFANCS